MSSEEFWSLTWEEYYAREECYLEEQRRWDERFGLMPSIYCNSHSKEGDPPKHAGFFFGYPAPGEETAADSDRELTPAESIALVKARFAKLAK